MVLVRIGGSVEEYKQKKRTLKAYPSIQKIVLTLYYFQLVIKKFPLFHHDCHKELYWLPDCNNLAPRPGWRGTIYIPFICICFRILNIFIICPRIRLFLFLVPGHLMEELGSQGRTQASQQPVPQPATYFQTCCSFNTSCIYTKPIWG